MSTFTKINGVNYIIDPETETTMSREISETITGWVGSTEEYQPQLVTEVIRDLMCMRVAKLVTEVLGAELATNSFITVAMSTNGGFKVSVGRIDKALVYGVLLN